MSAEKNQDQTEKSDKDEKPKPDKSARGNSKGWRESPLKAPD
jgi:hypothetical protein